MSTLTQSQMTEVAVEKMFEFWDANAPRHPKEGWFGSLKSSYDLGTFFFSCPIEDYDEDGFIRSIGKATVDFPSGEYEEIYF